MKVFKFGGASVQDAKGVANVAAIIQKFQPEKVAIVVSAMGKTTNAIEKISLLAYAQQSFEAEFTALSRFHLQVAEQLGLPEQNLQALLDILRSNLVNYLDLPFDQYYDQTVCYGELLSSSILSAWLEQVGQPNTLVNSGELIFTDNTWREGEVDMERSCAAIQQKLIPALAKGHIVTQGFMGRYSSAFYTTLGREGSDYSGAILAHCLDAEGLWIWKDVPGVLTGDPKQFDNQTLIPELSYYEAVEMTYYGASVIHPKTIQPLRDKQIPLFVRSFTDFDAPGTVVRMDDANRNYPPVLVLKKNQVLLSVATRDARFMAESEMSQVYRIFSELRVRINLMQTAAQSLSVCIDNQGEKTGLLLQTLQESFRVRSNDQVELLTVRHYTDSILQQLLSGREPLLTQRSRHTIQMVLPHS